LIGGNDVANYGQLTGGATTKAVEFKSLGSDTNVAYAIRPKGTGAIDLAAGSSGVNISNGGTVTALTRSAVGGSYTSNPTLAISAPTTAGGIQATATCTVMQGTITIAGGGTGYTAGDVLTFVGGTGSATTVTVSTVSSGVITAVTNNQFGAYSVVPANPISVTGGTGTGATFNSNWVLQNSFTITNAGSGYVEQPTVTFSGGGGSGAAAYASVGSGTTIKSIGSTMSFNTPGGEQVRIIDNSVSSPSLTLTRDTGNRTQIRGSGNLGLFATSGGAVGIYTNTAGDVLQMQVSHTASAVNYVQVTGAATGSGPTISAQGSDASADLNIASKGYTSIQFQVAGRRQFNISYSTGNTEVNYLSVKGANTGVAPVMSSVGSDTDISFALFPKGLGIVLMNQQTPAAVTATGTLTIANLLTQIITSTSATAVSLTLPTGTLSDAGVSGGTSAVNTSFNWSIINTGSAVGDVTLVAGTAHTIVGSATVAVGTTGSFRSRKTATNTFVSYRV
jgi:hypothetical protein